MCRDYPYLRTTRVSSAASSRTRAASGHSVDLSIDGRREVRLRVEGGHLPVIRCVDVTLATDDPHRVRAFVDSQFEVAESNERDNRFDEMWL